MTTITMACPECRSERIGNVPGHPYHAQCFGCRHMGVADDFARVERLPAIPARLSDAYDCPGGVRVGGVLMDPDEVPMAVDL